MTAATAAATATDAYAATDWSHWQPSATAGPSAATAEPSEPAGVDPLTAAVLQQRDVPMEGTK